MGMGYAGGYADVIDQENLIKLGKCGTILKQLEEVLDKEGYCLESFASGLRSDCYEMDDAPSNKCFKLYESLKKEFKKISGGLELELSFHDSDEEGDRYDDVNGAYWSVEGLYEETKKFKNFKKKFKKIKIERAHFVNFG